MSSASMLPWARGARSTPPQVARAALSQWWRGLWADERTRYLHAATDLPDLERRMRQWDDDDRRTWLPPR